MIPLQLQKRFKYKSPTGEVIVVEPLFDLSEFVPRAVRVKIIKSSRQKEVGQEWTVMKNLLLPIED